MNELPTKKVGIFFCHIEKVPMLEEIDKEEYYIKLERNDMEKRK